MKKLELMRIALKYVERSYDFGQLMDGDDLYNATPKEKDECGDYWSRCREIGIDAFTKEVLAVENPPPTHKKNL